MTKPKTKKSPQPTTKAKPPPKRTEHEAQLEEALGATRSDLEKAQGVLDIILRECAGESDEDIALDYGGTGWEKHEAVQVVRGLRQRSKVLADAVAESMRSDPLDQAAKIASLEADLPKYGKRIEELVTCLRDIQKTGTVDYAAIGKVLGG